MTDFKAIVLSLEEQGFYVVPEFLCREEIDFLLSEFDPSPAYDPESTATSRTSRKEAFAKMRPRMKAFAQGITGAMVSRLLSHF